MLRSHAKKKDLSLFFCLANFVSTSIHTKLQSKYLAWWTGV